MKLKPLVFYPGRKCKPMSELHMEIKVWVWHAEANYKPGMQLACDLISKKLDRNNDPYSEIIEANK